MGLCQKLNCCKSTAAKKEDGKEEERRPPAEAGDVAEQEQPQRNGVLPKEPPVYSVVHKTKQPKIAGSDTPVKAEFLVSFVVDSRGGAMRGCRGSGLRLLLPPGAVEQPLRVTCRFLRPHSHNLPFPPPLMERDALASGVIEVGPSGANFKLPVLVEVPHFAALGKEREIVTLRSDDGETWREHETYFACGGWDCGNSQEGELYQDVVQSTDLNRAADDLDTGRIVRISTLSFPKYFALISRIRGEVKTISPEGGRVESNRVSAAFPAGALKKKIKIGLQLQEVPRAAVEMVDKDIVDAYPLVGIQPRRRKFHHPIEVSVPVMSKVDVTKIWLLCSLSGESDKSVAWEDVSESAGVEIREGKHLVFETKVSALFWLFTTRGEGHTSERVLQSAATLYRELNVAPYMARLTVFYRRQFPFAWCDALRIYCTVGDRMDGFVEQREENYWTKVLAAGREGEVEVGDRCAYYFDLQGDLVVAADCQTEARLDDRLVFRAFQENSLTLLVRPKEKSVAKATASLIMKRQSALVKSRKDLHSTWVLNLPKVAENGDIAEKKETVAVQAEIAHDNNEAVETAEVLNDDYESITLAVREQS